MNNADEIVREPMEHELKCWPEYYDAVERGDKPFEIRKWDRPYRVGDTLLLRRYDPQTQDYTGQQVRRKITYLLDLTYLPGDNVPHFAGMCAIGMAYPQVASLQADLARMTAERDAAVRDLREAIFNDRTNSCSFCSHANQDPSAAPYCLANFCENDEWEWRGVQQAGK